MCLSIPAKVVGINGARVVVDVFGERREAELGEFEERVKIGDYVLIQYDFVVEILDRKVARESLKIWESLFEREN